MCVSFPIHTHAQSDELRDMRAEVTHAFSAPAHSKRVQVEPYGVNPNDGTFLMSFYDFYEFFTHVFAVIDFPLSWHMAEKSGEWTVSCPAPAACRPPCSLSP
jgi:hypothetical protein